MNCTNCGSDNPPGSTYCKKCGSRLEGSGVSSTPGTYAVHDRAFYGGFWRRFAAMILDSLILFVPMFIVFAMIGAGIPQWSEHDWQLNLLSLVATWLYFALTRSSAAQASPGQRALDLKVTDLQGQRLTFARATGRHFASILSGLTLGVGYLLNLFTARRQTLHDLIAGTLVYRSEINPLVPAQAPPPEGLKGWQIALVVFGCMIPVCGILAAIAIPAYADYAIRARVDQGMNEVAAYKVAIEKVAAGGTPWADISLDSLGEVEQSASPPFQDLVVDGGMIQLTFGAMGTDAIDGEVLALAPALSSGGEISWICGYSPPPPGFTAGPVRLRRLHLHRTEDLPPNCR